MRRKLPDRIIGRYNEDGEPDPRGRRVVYVAGGARCSKTFPTAKEATTFCRKVEREITAAQELTLAEAIEQYVADLRREGRRDITIGDRPGKLLSFFGEDRLDEPLSSLTPARCQRLYDRLVDEPRPYNGKCLSAATHQALLRYAKCFLAWCAASPRTWLPVNPAAEVRPVGTANAGKPQLRLDEARRWLAAAERLAVEGHIGAITAMTTLLLGARAGEVLSREVRDLDADGTLLWMSPAGHRSTKNAPPTREVPASLRPYLLGLAEGRAPGDRLFAIPWQAGNVWLNRQVQRICALAGVPRVCTHSLRGLHSTVATAGGVTPHVVAQALGHGSTAITRRHYIVPGTVEAAQQRRVLGLLSPPSPGPPPKAQAVLFVLAARGVALSDQDRQRILAAAPELLDGLLVQASTVSDPAALRFD